MTSWSIESCHADREVQHDTKPETTCRRWYVLLDQYRSLKIIIKIVKLVDMAVFSMYVCDEVRKNTNSQGFDRIKWVYVQTNTGNNHTQIRAAANVPSVKITGVISYLCFPNCCFNSNVHFEIVWTIYDITSSLYQAISNQLFRCTSSIKFNSI